MKAKKQTKLQIIKKNEQIQITFRILKKTSHTSNKKTKQK